jgi:hypothetical protein
MLVTAFYNIYPGKDRFFEYMSLFYDLAISGIPIIIFVEPSMVYKLRIFPSTVHVVGLPLKDCEIYQIAMAYSRELPVGRTLSKDTTEFYALMNTKIEFVKRATAIVPAQSYTWVDVGILKLCKDSNACIEKLRDLDQRPATNLIIPGCWTFGRAMNVDHIHWRFAGTMFSCPASLVEEFYNHCKGVVRDFCTMPQYKLTWETNIWTIVELFAMKDKIRWYMCNHDDSLILNC